MAKFFTYAENGGGQLTGLSTGSWNLNVDLSDGANYSGSAPSFPAGVSGGILRFKGSTAAYNIGARHPDSSTDRHDDLSGSSDSVQTDAYVGVNSSLEVDLYIEDSSVSVVSR